VSIVVKGLGFWAPGFADLDAWSGGVADETVTRPPAGLLPPILRRRTSRLTRAFVTVYEQATRCAEDRRNSLPTIFGSAHGEISTLPFLLDQGLSDEGGLSPIRFSGSVHNAGSGYLSIATGNTSFTTSIAAGDNTVAAAFQEAEAWLDCEGSDIVVLIGDDDSPAALCPSRLAFSAFAAAFLLGRAEAGPEAGARPHLGPVRWNLAAPPASTSLPPDYENHPCRPALHLLEALLEDSGTVALGARGGPGVEVRAGSLS